MAEQQPKLVFTQEDLDQLFRIYGMGDEDIPESEVEAKVAQSMIDTYNSGYGTVMSYNEFFNAGVSDSEIISTLASDPEGNPIKTGTFLQGMKKEAIPTAASVPTFMGGYTLGSKLVSGVAPTTVPTAAVRLGFPLLTGTLGGIGGYILGAEVADEVLSDEPVILPIHREKYEAGRTATGVLGFAAMPFMVKPQLNFGVELARQKLAGSPSKVTSAVEFLEGTVGQMGQKARANPFSFGAFEAVAGAGQTGGAYLAESAYPGQVLPRLGFELGGGLTTSVAADLMVTRLINGFKLGKQAYGAVKEGKLQDALQYLGDERKRQATNYILDVIEQSGEDPEEIIRRLGSQEFTDILVDEAGNPIQLTAALKSGSPALLALEKALEKTSAGVGKERASANINATRALRNTITALFASDDPDAVQEGAVLAQAVFENELSGELAAATKKLFDAFKNIGEPESRQAQLGEALQTILEERLKAARVNERRLWRDVDRSFVIEEFTDESGNVTDIPQFVQFLDDRLPSTEEAKNALSNELRPLLSFHRRKKEELGLIPEDELIPDLSDMSPRLRNATERFDEAASRLGEEDRNILNRQIDRAQELDPEDAANMLREESSFYRTRAKDYDDPRMVQRLALALDRAADLQLARRIEPEAVADEISGLSANEIFDMYSTALNVGKKLNAQGDAQGANIAFGFARSLMNDLDNANVDDAAYNTARAYTRALNDAFTRTFANELLADERTGRLKILPDQVAQRIFAADAGSLRVKQLDTIGQFELTQALTTLSEQAGNPDLTKTLQRAMAYARDEETGLMNTARLNRWLSNNRRSLANYPEVLSQVEEAVKTTSDIRGTMESMVRNIRAAAFNPDTGEISMVGLRRWMENPNNQDLLKAMPALKADLENSVTAGNLLDATNQNIREQRDALKGTVSFMDLLPDATENPATAASKALSNNQKQPIQSLNNLLKVVQKAPDKWQVGNQTYTKEDAMNGLRTALIDAAMVKAGGTSQTFNSKVFFDTIFTPLRNSKGNVSLADWMTKNEVMSTVEINRLKAFATELVKMETFAAKGDVNLEDIAETVGPMMDFYLRVAGASVGSRMQTLIPGDTGAGSLVAAGAGSKAFRAIYGKIFSEIPESLKMDVMSEMFADPDLLAAMLAKGKTDREQTAIAKRIATKLGEKGFLAATTPARRAAPGIIRESGEDVELPEGQVDPVLQRAQELLKQREEVKSKPPVGNPTTQAALPAAPQTSVAAGTNNPQVRQTYAALFPNDPISSMITQQPRSFRRGGIASLME
jgi:hypothetical protein